MKESGRTWVTTYVLQRLQQDVYFTSISLIFKTSEHFQNNDKLSKFHYQAQDSLNWLLFILGQNHKATFGTVRVVDTYWIAEEKRKICYISPILTQTEKLVKTATWELLFFNTVTRFSAYIHFYLAFSLI